MALVGRALAMLMLTEKVEHGPLLLVERMNDAQQLLLGASLAMFFVPKQVGERQGVGGGSQVGWAKVVINT